MLAAFGPLAVELGRGLISRFIAPDEFKPANIADWLSMRNADVTMFQTMNAAGGGLSSYAWVAAVVTLQRPFVATVALGVWAYAHTVTPVLPADAVAAIDNFAGAVGFYLFGDRTLFHAQRLAANKTAAK